jgi:2'-5' RNA ligase
VGRLFVAVWPPASLVSQLRDLERPARPGLRWTTEDQWHVTIRFLGAVDEVEQRQLQGLLGKVATALDVFEVRADPAAQSLGRAVWVLPVAGLDTLAARVAEATRGVGQPPPNRPFRGHITLARARRPGALAGLRTSMSLTQGEAGASGRWRITEITLVRSDLRPEGARYEVLGRWPLGVQPTAARS